MKASARKDAGGRFRAVVVYPTGRTRVVARKLNGSSHRFDSREEAVAWAQRWIDVNTMTACRVVRAAFEV